MPSSGLIFEGPQILRQLLTKNSIKPTRQLYFDLSVSIPTLRLFEAWLALLKVPALWPIAANDGLQLRPPRTSGNDPC